MKIILQASKNLNFVFIDDLLMTGLAVEAANMDNALNNPGNVVELFDFGNAFLHLHLGNADRLLDENSGYYSPILICAFNLLPEQVDLRLSRKLNQY